ncbi:hypothetical protein A2U01_0015037 [Trifolium medium]|uniref:Uncharacterized protein n=1 Tax=Trifolium medium TaxID=97028 RepID=A0A392N3D4_9FABA|nr:hypothetical protein [Trifolium medium]
MAQSPRRSSSWTVEQGPIVGQPSKRRLKSTADLPNAIVMHDIGMMSIYCSSWLPSRSSTAIDDIKHARQRSWPSAGAIYTPVTQRSQVHYSTL